jgi:hypothetical protein
VTAQATQEQETRMVRIVLRVLTPVLMLGLLGLTVAASCGFVIPLGIRELIGLFALSVLVGVMANRLTALSPTGPAGPASTSAERASIQV